MECGCSCGYDFDPPEFFNVNSRTARKEHECCECSCVIEKGEEYDYVSGKWDGEFSSFKICETCGKIRRDFAPCSAFGGLREEIWACHGICITTGEIDERYD